jgi:hypothetical protein
MSQLLQKIRRKNVLKESQHQQQQTELCPAHTGDKQYTWRNTKHITNKANASVISVTKPTPQRQSHHHQKPDFLYIPHIKPKIKRKT